MGIVVLVGSSSSGEWSYRDSGPGGEWSYGQWSWWAIGGLKCYPVGSCPGGE